MSYTRFDIHRDELERLIDGTLGEPGRRVLLEYAKEDAERQAELDWILAVSRDLETIGDRVLRDAPIVDVVADVLARLPQRPARKAVPFHAPERPAVRRPRVARMLLAAAVVAVIAGALAFLWLSGPSVVEAPGIAGEDGVAVPDAGAPPLVITATPGPDLDDSLQIAGTTQPDVGPDAPEPPGPRARARNAVVTAFRGMLAGGLEDAGRLVEWASLTPDELSAALARGEMSPEALAAAAAGLPLEEAVPLLMQAISMDPENPALRLQLAMTLTGRPDQYALAMEHINAMQALDAENALALYLRAERFLGADPPDVHAALNAFQTAQTLDAATAYGRETANAREAALLAAGVEPAVAQMLGAFTAGRWEYDQQIALANQLMGHGREYLAAGDSTTAQAIFEAVLEMGRQIDQGASLAQDRQAGIDIQRAAIEALQPVYSAAGQVAEIQRLLEAANGINAALGQLTEYLGLVNVQIGGIPLESAFWLLIADTILREGDLDLLDAIAGLLP